MKENVGAPKNEEQQLPKPKMGQSVAIAFTHVVHHMKGSKI